MKIIPVILLNLLFFHSICAQESVSIGILTDCQYGNFPPRGERNYRGSVGKLKQCVSFFNERKPSAVFHLGDMIDHNWESYDSVLPVFAQFQSPFFAVTGNHDFMVGKENKEKVLSRIGLTKSYYHWVTNGWKIIVLDGNDLSFNAPQNEEQRRERNWLVQKLFYTFRLNGWPWNGGIGQEQWKWLDSQLKEAERSGEKVIVMCHFPFFARKDHNLFNNKEMFQYLAGKTCVKAYFCGHYHRGGYTEREGLHVVNFKGMVNTEDNAFAEVELTADSILITGYGRETNRRLAIRK